MLQKLDMAERSLWEVVEQGPVWLFLNRAYDTSWPDRETLEKYLGPGLAVRREAQFKNMHLFEIGTPSYLY